MRRTDLRKALISGGVAVAALATLACIAVLPVAGAAPSNPNPGLAFAPASPLTGDAVTFTANSSEIARITKFQWDLDGSGSFETSTGGSRTATRSYARAGTIKVRVMVTYKDGGDKIKTSDPATVTIGDRPPTASFSWSPAAPKVNDPVTFTANAGDPDGTIASIAWDLNGDGNFDNGGGTTALRSFAAPGSYVVGVRATDSEGQTTFSSKTVTVAGVAVVKNGAKPRLISPFPVVRISGRIDSRGARVRLLVVEAPHNTKVSIRCSGGGCPFRKQVRSAGGGSRVDAAKRIRVHSLERLLPVGVTVRVFVTKRGAIGKYTRFRIRRDKAPGRVDRCLMPGSWEPARCPGS